MRLAYRLLAYLVAIGVAVQAAAIAFAMLGLTRWIEDGGVLDKAGMESESTGFTGDLGFAIHGIAGQLVIPLIAILLLVCAFFARIPRGVLWAGIVVLLVALQVVLGIVSSAVVGLGLLHGLNALLLFAAAVFAARLRDGAGVGADPAASDRTIAA